jgi:hypothetical protein
MKFYWSPEQDSKRFARPCSKEIYLITSKLAAPVPIIFLSGYINYSKEGGSNFQRKQQKLQVGPVMPVFIYLNCTRCTVSTRFKANP